MDVSDLYSFYCQVKFSSAYQGKMGLTGPSGPPGQKVNSFTKCDISLCDDEHYVASIE